MTELDDQVVAEFRANAGIVLHAMGGHFSNIHLLLLHNTGRRSGRLYVTPLLYVEDGDRYVLIGSNGGAEKEPAWVANVAAMPEVVIEVGEQMLRRRRRSCGAARNGTASTRRRWPIGPTSSSTRPTPTARSR
jgi:deazaflavin-dependent oxidoreductase (nitroreductase family)